MKVIKFIGTGIAGLLGIGGKKAAPAAAASASAALPVATRDDARIIAMRNDAVRRRKGSASDIITGATGAEAALSTPGKFVLGN